MERRREEGVERGMTRTDTLDGDDDDEDGALTSTLDGQNALSLSCSGCKGDNVRLILTPSGAPGRGQAETIKEPDTPTPTTHTRAPPPARARARARMPINGSGLLSLPPPVAPPGKGGAHLDPRV